MSTSSGSTSLKFRDVSRLLDRLLARGSPADRFLSQDIGKLTLDGYLSRKWSYVGRV